jgi:hypothetical protein
VSEEYWIFSITALKMPSVNGVRIISILASFEEAIRLIIALFSFRSNFIRFAGKV